MRIAGRPARRRAVGRARGGRSLSGRGERRAHAHGEPGVAPAARMQEHGPWPATERGQARLASSSAAPGRIGRVDQKAHDGLAGFGSVRRRAVVRWSPSRTVRATCCQEHAGRRRRGRQCSRAGPAGGLGLVHRHVDPLTEELAKRLPPDPAVGRADRGRRARSRRDGGGGGRRWRDGRRSGREPARENPAPGARRRASSPRAAARPSGMAQQASHGSSQAGRSTRRSTPRPRYITGRAVPPRRTAAEGSSRRASHQAELEHGGTPARCDAARPPSTRSTQRAGRVNRAAAWSRVGQRLAPAKSSRCSEPGSTCRPVG